jgi:predicted aspartyl protease
MGQTVFYLGLAIIVTALLALVFFADGGSVAGMDPSTFASLASLAAVALLVGSGLLHGRHRANMRLWHAALWLALLVALMAGFQAFGGGSL